MKVPQKSPDGWIEALHDPSVSDHLPAILAQGPSPAGKYRHWDTVRRCKPPANLTHEQWWAALKIARLPFYRPIPLRDVNGETFKYALVDPVIERLHRIDRDASGRILLPEDATNEDQRDRYIASSIVEEAIRSSQLEGAATTRVVAKDMLRSGRKPSNRSERMIANNYKAMQFIRENAEEDLSWDFVNELHDIVTDGTLEAGQSKFRSPGDGIRVYSDTGQLLHDPPSADEIEDRMDRMCEFANSDSDSPFLHPVLRAIILHFWLAYDHPYSDGNGRTARALFYWQMLRSDFWLGEFISISSVIKKAPAKYGESFLYTETDENDLTYFLLAQLRVIEQAIEALQQYLGRKTMEMQEARRLLRPSAGINHRQVALLSHALRNPSYEYTVAGHQASHDVAYDTARNDLLELSDRGLLGVESIGRKYVFVPVRNLAKRLKKLR